MIFWEMLLKTDKIGDRLKEMYDDFGGIGPLSQHLGVSKVTLLRKLKECNIERRSRGGAHFRVPREALPDKWWEIETDVLCKMTGYTPNYVRKLRRAHRCASEASTKAKQQASSTE